MSEPQFKRGRLLSKNEISGGVTPLTSRKSRRMCRISSPAPAASQQLSPQSEGARAAAERGGGRGEDVVARRLPGGVGGGGTCQLCCFGTAATCH